MIKQSAIEQYDINDYGELFGGNYNKLEGKCFSEVIYNQIDIDNYSCTTHAALGVLNDFLGIIYPFSMEFRKACFKRQVDTTFKSGYGDSIQNGIKQVVKEFNRNLEKPIVYRKIRLTEENIKKAIDNKSSITTGWKGATLADEQDNGKLDISDNNGKIGHSIRIVKYMYVDGDFQIKYVESFKGKLKYDIITVPKFSLNKDFFAYGYYLSYK